MSATSIVENSGAPLVRIDAGGWRIGLANLVRKEFGQWWGTRMWWIQTLVWIVILNGITTMIMLDIGGSTDAELTQEAMQAFFQIAATAVGIAIILTVQGSIVGEKELGTAAWVMSKPASRTSFILSKIAAYFVGFLVTALLIPSAIFLVEAKFLLPDPISFGSFGVGLCVLALSVLFFVALTLMLGAFFKGRGPIAGIGVGLILMGQFFKSMLPLPLVLVTPWLLGDTAGLFASGAPTEWNWVVPLVAVTLETLAIASLAVWRFGHEEL